MPRSTRCAGAPTRVQPSYATSRKGPIGPRATGNRFGAIGTRHVQQTRAHIDAKKAALDASDAEDAAEWAEVDAEDAINFAASAITEAEYALLDAVRARKRADALAESA